ncbi:MAG TPA: hypothetical protein VIX63_04855, partial [Vicinamibacterales bacterium]
TSKNGPTVWNGLTLMESAMLNAQCSMLNAQCPMLNAQGSMPKAQCSMPKAQGSMLNAQAQGTRPNAGSSNTFCVGHFAHCALSIEHC